MPSRRLAPSLKQSTGLFLNARPYIVFFGKKIMPQDDMGAK